MKKMKEKPRKSPKLPPNSATRDSQECRYSFMQIKPHHHHSIVRQESRITSVFSVVSEEAIQTLMKQTSSPYVEYLVNGNTWEEVKLALLYHNKICWLPKYPKFIVNTIECGGLET